MASTHNQSQDTATTSPNNLLTLLAGLQQELETVRKITEDDINVFSEVGLGKQEVRHSTFLARLLDPKKPHGLGNAMLKKFCEQLFQYQIATSYPQGYSSNQSIL